MTRSFTKFLVAAALFETVVLAQEGVKPTDLRTQRMISANLIRSQLLINTSEDARRVTKEYVESQLSEIRSIIQDQMLETLGQSEKPRDVLDALAAMVGKMNRGSEADAPFVYQVDLQGLKAVVIGYYVAHGPAAIPKTRVLIEAFRKAGGNYELAAETGDALNNCGLVLEPLNSPRSN